MSKVLQFRLFGQPQISLDGQPLTAFSTRKAQALLIYLAVTSYPHTREKLAGLFWPDMPDRQALKNLRTILPNLRRLVTPYLTVTRETIAFNREELYWLDLEILQTTLEGKAAAIDTQRLWQILDLYQDDFLAGWYVRNAPPFEEWVMMERERLRRLVVRGLNSLTERCLSQGDNATGLKAVERLLQLEPWLETAHQQRMLLLAYRGQRSAALAQYEACRQILSDEFDVAPMPETTRLYEAVKSGEVGRQGRSVMSALSGPLIDWGDIPRATRLYGRQDEIDRLHHWLVTERHQVVAILGIGGQGKTALAAALVRALVDGEEMTDLADSQNPSGLDSPFERLIWRSLGNAPPLANVLRSWLSFLSDQQTTRLPDHLDEQLTLLLAHLQGQRCLLILDNVESILKPGERAGYYRPGYEGYGHLLQRLHDAEHQSCLLLTSRECPKGVDALAAEESRLQVLHLGGVAVEAGQKLLQARGLTGSDETLQALVQRYAGNPLALKLVARTIQELYAGDAEAFLDNKVVIFEELRDILDQQCDRLSSLEQELVTRLAKQHRPVTAHTLWDELPQPLSKGAFLESLQSLRRRSLLERRPKGSRFALPNLFSAYMAEREVEVIR